MPKVSVVIPIYNVAPYLKECLESVIHQTLKDIEIICVNDGSTDESLSIIKKFAENDKRIKIIDKINSGYGDSMNRGIDIAQGEYLGIVEPDDYIRLTMFEDLTAIADRNQADIVKADFYRFVHNGQYDVIRKYIQLTQNEKYYNTILDPTTEQEVFKFVMNTWSGIYRLSFLNQFHIRHNTTPGASFQDNGFWFKGFCLSHKVYFVDIPYYMNRRDNPNSSVKNPEKVYCANTEYAYIKNFLIQNKLFDTFKDVFLMKYFHNCMFTLNRIAQEFKLEYLSFIAKEFSGYLNEGALHEPYFTYNEIQQIRQIVTDYKVYYEQMNEEILLNKLKNENLVLKDILYHQTNSISFKIGRFITFLPRRIRNILK